MSLSLHSLGIAILAASIAYLWNGYRRAPKAGQWRWTAWVGVLVLVGAESLLFLGVKVVGLFFTPLVWTGYILLVDGLVFKLRGESLIFTRRKDFLILLPLSLGWWLVFELYNLHLRNWVYVGLPENVWARYAGYVWSFVTIMPAIFETTELIGALGLFGQLSQRRYRLSDRTLKLWGTVGFAFLIFPLLVPRRVAQYLFGFIWLGFILAIDPVNYKWGRPSLLRDFQQGEWSRLLNLLSAGLFCGFLWEFWNYWAQAHWIYTFPILQSYKIFQMPIPGYLGFPPFALECYVLVQFSYGVLAKLGWMKRSAVIMAHSLATKKPLDQW